MNSISKFMKTRKWQLLWFILFCGCFSIWCIFFVLRIDNVLDSDIAAQLVMSKLLADENSFWTTNWYNSTEIRILSYQLVFVPLFWLTSNWQIVRVVGSIILYLIILAGVLYVCWQLGIRKYFFLVATFFVLPFSKEYLLYVLVNINYTVPISISLFSIGLAIHFMKCNSTKLKIMLGILAGAISLGSGMNGLRSLFSIYVPLFITSIICMLFLSAEFEGWRKNKKFGFNVKICDLFKTNYGQLGIISAWMLMCSGIGYIINKVYLSEIIEYIDYSDGAVWQAFSIQRVLDTITGWLANLGYVTGEPLFSYALIHNAISILLMIVVIAIIVAVLRHRFNYTREIYFISVFIAVACVMSVLLFGFTEMYQQARYDVVVLIYVFPLMTLFISQSKACKESKKNLYLSVLLSCVLFNSILFYDEYSEENDTRELKEVIEFLQANEYKNGYATFWHGNVVTELTNGEITVFVLQRREDIVNVNQIEECECPVAHTYEIPEGKVFWIFTHPEKERYTITRNMDDEYILFTNEEFCVYGFESYDEMVGLIENS